MSSILKALKKLEHDKAVRKPDTFRIDTDILQDSASRKQISTGKILTALAIFACGAGAAYLYMKDDSRLLEARPGLPVLQRDKTVSPGKEAARSETIAPVPSAAPENQLIQPAQQNTRIKKTDLFYSNIKPEDPRQLKPAEVSSQQHIEQKQTPMAVPIVPSVPIVKPVLKVHGIAFQDGADSAAVVNGMTVSVGSTVEGARVEDIQKDRVRFSRGGEAFDIILDKAN